VALAEIFDICIQEILRCDSARLSVLWANDMRSLNM
jgi:hypothetical protein